MAKKLSPQQKRVQEEKNIAKGTKIENLLMDSEVIKQQIDKSESIYKKLTRKHRETISKLEIKQNKAKRLIKYKRDQIVARNK